MVILGHGDTVEPLEDNCHTYLGFPSAERVYSIKRSPRLNAHMGGWMYMYILLDQSAIVSALQHPMQLKQTPFYCVL